MKNSSLLLNSCLKVETLALRLTRIARVNEPEPTEPVVIPIPEAIEPEIVAKVEQLAPVNDLASKLLAISEQISSNVYTDTAQPVQETAKYIHDDDEAIALIMILAEID